MGASTERSRSVLQAAALTAFVSTLAVFNESTKSGFAREARRKCCKYPRHNFCNGYREGTKQPFLAWPLWTDDTRAIKQASYWDASIPVSCLRAGALFSSAMAMAGPPPAAGRAHLPFGALYSHFSSSLFSSLPAQPAPKLLPPPLLPFPIDWGPFCLEVVGNSSVGAATSFKPNISKEMYPSQESLNLKIG